MQCKEVPCKGMCGSMSPLLQIWIRISMLNTTRTTKNSMFRLSLYIPQYGLLQISRAGAVTGPTTQVQKHLSTAILLRTLLESCICRDTGPRRHKCSEPIPNDEICERCGGLHRWNMPCFIQPCSIDRLNTVLKKRRRPFKNPNSIDITETDDDETEDDADDNASTTNANGPKAMPYRYFIFDIECAQEAEVQPGRFKHEPLLVCAELICTECIKEGIKIGANDNPPRPDTCICKGAEFINHRVRRWVVPGSDGRQFQFHNFDDANINPLDEMLNFLCNHGPKECATLALSHNGIIYYIHIKV